MELWEAQIWLINAMANGEEEEEEDEEDEQEEEEEEDRKEDKDRQSVKSDEKVVRVITF